MNVQLTSLEGKSDQMCAVTAHGTARVHRHSTLKTQKPPGALLVVTLSFKGAKGLLVVGEDV